MLHKAKGSNLVGYERFKNQTKLWVFLRRKFARYIPIDMENLAQYDQNIRLYLDEIIKIFNSTSDFEDYSFDVNIISALDIVKEKIKSS